MFGHGSDNCNVNTFCSKCAGPHKTTECKTDIVKCANCHGDHKSTDNSCPSRSAYIGLRQRVANRQSRNIQQISHFERPNGIAQQNVNLSQQNYGNRSWANVVSSSNTNNNDLFSIEQLKSLTFDLINNLKNCKNKVEQFDVITSLAFKFLS